MGDNIRKDESILFDSMESRSVFRRNNKRLYLNLL